MDPGDYDDGEGACCDGECDIDGDGLIVKIRYFRLILEPSILSLG